MASLLAKYVSKKFLAENLENKFGSEDPYFESVPATRLDGTPSKKRVKKIRKALPPGLSDHDGRVLTKVKRRAYRLDMCLFSLCGIRFGWGSVIGLVPAIGDILDAFMAMMVFRTCQQVEGGLPNDVRAKMMFNIIIDFFIGLVPFLGDVADAAFKANTKNAAELEKFLRKKGAKNLEAAHLPQPLVDPSDPDEFDRIMSGPTPPDYTSDGPRRNDPMRPDPVRQAAPRQGAYAGQQPMGSQQPVGQQTGTTARQTGTTTQTTTTTTQKAGFFSRLFGGSGSQQPDLEAGNGNGSRAGHAMQPHAGSRRVDEPLPPVPSQTAQGTRQPTLQKTRR